MGPLTFRRLRVLLLAGCVVAAILLAARAPGLARELQQDRRAALLYRDGMQLHQQGRYTEAEEAFAEALRLAPSAVEVYGSLAEAQRKQGRTRAAVATYRRLLGIYPYTYTGTLYREVGLIELRAGELSAARADLRTAVTLDPDDWMGWYLLGHTHRRLGETAAARGAWQRVTVLRPEFVPAREQLRALEGSR